MTKIWSGLAAGSAVVVLALTGCGSSGSSAAGPAAGRGGASATATAPAATASARPSWAAALGSHVTLIAPSAPVTPGHGSPQAAVEGYLHLAMAGRIMANCQNVEPAQRAQCRTEVSTVEATLGPKALAGAVLHATDFAFGYAAVDGDRALVGTTGTICSGQSPRKCATNHDRAAVLSSGKSFAALWKATVNAHSSAYALVPCIKADGKWYLYSQF